MRRNTSELERLGVAVLAVTWEPPARAAEYARDMDVGFPVVSDPGRAAYRAFGLLERGRHSYGSPRFWWVHVLALLGGRLRAKPRGTLPQLGGDVVIAPDGAVAYRHASREPVDRPAAGELLAALRALV